MSDDYTKLIEVIAYKSGGKEYYMKRLENAAGESRYYVARDNSKDNGSTSTYYTKEVAEKGLAKADSVTRTVIPSPKSGGGGTEGAGR